MSDGKSFKRHLNIKGKFLITIGTTLIILVSVSLIWTFQQEKKMIQLGLEKTTKINSELINNSLHVFMESGLQEKFSEFLRKSNTIEGVQEIKLIKPNSGNDVELTLLKTGGKISKFNQSDMTYQEVYPFIAIDGCLDCHKVKPGEILGAASITIKQSDILNRANFNKKTFIGFGLIQAVIILTILYFIIGTIVQRPLVKLTSVVNKFSKGESDISANIKTYDEFGHFAAIFFKMIEKIGLQLDYLENIPTPITVIDKDFNIQYINKAGAEFVGKERSQCLHEKCYKLFKMSHCQSQKCCTQKALQLKTECSDETIAFPKEMKLPVLYTAVPLKDKDGEQIGALESFTDISGYKSLLNEVKSQETYLAASTKKMLVEMEKFSIGDLRVKLTPEREDEIGKLFHGFNNAIENIAKILTNVKETIVVGASAGVQISSRLEEMSTGAQQQNQQALEIVSAVEEMTRTILENAENASKASDASKQAKGRAKKGEEVMQQTQQGMSKIINSARKTGEIISSFAKKADQIDVITQLIDDIADQTNLLALNAAIEAARAGEQGRGFAVVADEVRSLAERTTQATKEISNTIKAIQMDAEQANGSKLETDSAITEGLQLIEEIGKSFQDILEESDIVSDIVSQVATATEEQSTTSEQISKNIASISEVSRQAAIGIEQIAVTADHLSQLMEKLQSMIQQFKVEENGEYEKIEFGEEAPETVANAFEFVNN